LTREPRGAGGIPWVGENLADRIELNSNAVGDLAFFKGVPATA
jgi:hypothetical protein